MRSTLVCEVALAVALGPASAGATDMFGDNYKPCGDQNSTAQVIDCVSAKTKVWDQRLNTAYAALQKVVDPAQRDPLRKAQRTWLQYRDANCDFYFAGEGTIHQVQSAKCVRAMTQDRALELEQAAKP